MKMMMKSVVISALLSSVAAFAPVSPTLKGQTQLNVLPEVSSNLVSLAEEGASGEAAKAVVITLFLGGGLIPALIGGNKAMMDTLMGASVKKGPAAEEDPDTSFDPTLKDKSNIPLRQYVEASGATGPELQGSAFLFAKEKIPLVDIIAVIGRIGSVEDLADWRNLPSTKRLGSVGPEPPMWLPRRTYKVNMRKAKWLGWPVDPKTGEPIGGAELKKAEEGRISKKGALIGDAAMDAVWDTWALGASIATPDKVAKALRNYRQDAQSLNVGGLVGSIAAGRSVTGIAALTFVIIQVIAFGTLFIGPALRTFADIDIGFGGLGECDPEKCLYLNPFY